MNRITEHVYFQQCVVEGTLANGVYPSTYIDLATMPRLAFLVALGDTDATTVAFQVVQATSAAGTGSKAVDGATFTFAGTQDDKFVVLEVEARRLDINNGFRYVGIQATVTGGSATEASVFFLGWELQKLPPVLGTDCLGVVAVDG